MNLNKTLVLVGVVVISLAFWSAFTRNIQDVPSEVVIVEDQVNIHYFWSPTCPYCLRQNEFWNEFLERYPESVLHRYSLSDRATASIFTEIAREYGAEQYAGTVPVTFIGDEYFVGFDNSEGVGRAIEEVFLLEREKFILESSEVEVDLE